MNFYFFALLLIIAPLILFLHFFLSAYHLHQIFYMWKVRKYYWEIPIIDVFVFTNTKSSVMHSCVNSSQQGSKIINDYVISNQISFQRLKLEQSKWLTFIPALTTTRVNCQRSSGTVQRRTYRPGFGRCDCKLSRNNKGRSTTKTCEQFSWKLKERQRGGRLLQQMEHQLFHF